MKKELAILPVGHGGAGLEALMTDVGCNECFIEDERGILEAGLDVAEGPLVWRVPHGESALFVVFEVVFGPLDVCKLRDWRSRRLGSNPDVAVLAGIRSAGA